MSTQPAPFGAQDFRDLVRLLEQHPEWRAELRRLVLSDELLELPALMRDLVQAQRRTEERLEGLAEAQRRTEEALQALVSRTDLLEQALQALISRTGRIETRLGSVTGEVLEARYRAHSSSYFSPLLRRPRPLSQDELDDLLDTGSASAALSADEVQDIRRADIVVRGHDQDGGLDRFLVVEVSAVIDLHDVERARRRAAALRKLSPAEAVAAGEQATPDAEFDARRGGVWQVLDGRVVPPQAADSH